MVVPVHAKLPDELFQALRVKLAGDKTNFSDWLRAKVGEYAGRIPGKTTTERIRRNRPKSRGEGYGMWTRIATVLFLAMALCGFKPTNGYPSDDKVSRESLEGVKKVYVIVEDLDSDELKTEFPEAMLTADVQSELRQNGIQAASKAEAFHDVNIPTLSFVTTTILLKDGKRYIYNVSVSLDQTVTLPRNSKVTTATTWSVDFLGITSRSNAVNKIRETIKDCVDKFVNAYLSVNPKK